MSDDSERKFELLPTGKLHISYSEMRDWVDCSWRHRQKYVNKIDIDKPGELMDFGTSVHSSCENFIKTGVMDPKISENRIREFWKERNWSNVETFIESSNHILDELPQFMNETFEEWKGEDAEHALYEQIDVHPQAFKGFIDCVISVNGKKNKRIWWLIDFKTTSWGWSMEKKTDPNVKAQLVLYKNFWAKKFNIDPKDVRCAFLLLKRTAKDGQRCELVPVSVGDVTTGRSLKVVNNMLSAVKRGIAIKNRNSCQYCQYKDTIHCT